jgi:hypothetical protein
MNQSRNKTEYDSNYVSCYNVTGIASDLWNSGVNNTYFEYRATEYCAFCTNNLANTSWGSWNNGTCAGDQMNQSRNRTQYDINNCSNYTNITIFSYQSVGPSLANTSFTNWTNLSCLITNLMNQSRNFTEYDAYSCKANLTYFEYNENYSCTYVPPADPPDGGGGGGGGSSGGGGGDETPTQRPTEPEPEENPREIIINDTVIENQTLENPEEYQCDDWSECGANFNLGNVVNNTLSSKGERKRSCTNLQTGDVSEEIVSCNIDKEVTVRIKEDLVEVVDSTGEVVSELNFDERNNQLNVKFPVANVVDSCVDEIMNNDETDIDCGGSCGSCVKYKAHSTLWRIILFFLIIIILIVAHLIVIWILEILENYEYGEKKGK